MKDLDAVSITGKYKEFVTMQYSSHTLLMAAVANTVFNVLIFPDFGSIAHSPVQPSFYALTTLLRFAAVGMFWIVWAYKTDGSILSFDPSPHMQHPWVVKLQSLCPIIMTVVLFIIVVTNTNGGPLNSGQLYMIMCALQAYPLVTSFILRDTNPMALGISWLMCISTLLVNGIQTQSVERLADMLAYSFTSGIILYDTYRQNKNMFRLVTKLLDTLRENEQLAVEAQALELRAMIGNIAHDLKTV